MYLWFRSKLPTSRQKEDKVTTDYLPYTVPSSSSSSSQWRFGLGFKIAKITYPPHEINSSVAGGCLPSDQYQLEVVKRNNRSTGTFIHEWMTVHQPRRKVVTVSYLIDRESTLWLLCSSSWSSNSLLLTFQLSRGNNQLWLPAELHRHRLPPHVEQVQDGQGGLCQGAQGPQGWEREFWKFLVALFFGMQRTRQYQEFNWITKLSSSSIE